MFELVKSEFPLQVLANSGCCSSITKWQNLYPTPNFPPPVMIPEQSQICVWWGLFILGNPPLGDWQNLDAQNILTSVPLPPKPSIPIDDLWIFPNMCLVCTSFSSAPSYMIHALFVSLLQLVLVLHLDEIPSVLGLSHMKKGLNACKTRVDEIL